MVYQYLARWVYYCVIFMFGSTRRLNRQWFWFKTSQKMGAFKKSHLTDWWSPGSNSGPLGTRRVTYPLHHTRSIKTKMLKIDILLALKALMLVGWFCCFRSQVNSYGHCGTVSSPNHTFSWVGLNKRLTSNSCTYFPL